MFVYLWASKHKLSPTDSIKYYLFRVLRRGILAQKQLAIQSSSAFWVEILLAESNPSVEQELIEQQQNQEKKQRLADGIEQLPLRQKEAVFLRFYENLAYAQIAEIMSISPRAVYKLIYKAIDALQKNMLLALAGLLLLCSFLELLMA